MIQEHPESDFAQGIFVVNQQEKLQGYVSVREMLITPPSKRLGAIMRPVAHKAYVHTARQEVIDLVEGCKLPALAVVDDEERLVGVITGEDVLEALEDLTDETMAMIAGTGECPHIDQTVLARCFARSPWLFVTLLSGFLNVGMMSSSGQYFGDAFFFIFFFVPLVTGLSGNIGIQCSTVLVRNFALGAVSSRSKPAAMGKELASGLLSGFFFGLLCGGCIYFFASLFAVNLGVAPFSVALVVAAGLTGACFAGTFLGVFSTLFFLKIGVDPAISSGPIITAFNDFLSMFIYFFIAWGLHAVFLS